MKKNIFSDSEHSKSAKGFYAAVGISVAMIGSACWFAYSENQNAQNELTANQQQEMSDAAVDKKSTDVPKHTAVSFTYSFRRETRPTVTAVEHTAEAPAVIAETIPQTEPVTEPTVDAAKMSNVYAPLADMTAVVNPFSGSELVKSETTGSWQTHNGTDISAEVSTEVFAVYDGEVMAVNDDPLWGTTVEIDHHNGYTTKYCGLAKDLSVQAGDVVSSGQLIGAVGDTADIESALGSHLHIEATHNGEYIDPVSLLK